MKYITLKCDTTKKETLHLLRKYPEKRRLKALQERGAMRPGDIAAAAGVDKEEAAKVIKKLAKEGKIYSPKRCFYDIQK